MVPVQRRALLVGLGRSGAQVAAAHYLHKQAYTIAVSERQARERFSASLADLAELRIEYEFSCPQPSGLDKADLICYSAAVRPRLPVRAKAETLRLPWTTEMNLFLSALSTRPWCVTGSNGKTTTTSLLAHVLEQVVDSPVYVGGNIGYSLLADVETLSEHTTVVLELSSFQLEDAKLASGSPTTASPRVSFTPRVAIVTHVVPNHLDYHKDFDEYVAAKRHLVDCSDNDSIVVLNRSDPTSFSFGTGAKARVVSFGLEDGFDGAGTFVAEGVFYYRSSQGTLVPIVKRDALRLRGRHNDENVASVIAAVCGYFDATSDGDWSRHHAGELGSALCSFSPLAHRTECVGIVAERSFINDSKATTPQAAMAAIASTPKPFVLLAGGVGKGMCFGRFVDEAVKGASGLCFFGANAKALAGQSSVRAAQLGFVQLAIEACETLDQAFARATAMAPEQSTVLLSPACASLDQYPSYIERGLHFRSLVENYAADNEPSGCDALA